jgi:drug/metabolite transporter (DMT)-like permease
MKFNLIGCVALLLWASVIPFAKHCSEEIGPLTVGALQYAAGGFIGLLSNLALGKFGAADREFLKSPQFYGRAALFSTYVTLLYFAIGTVDRSDLPVVTLLNYLWPTATMLLSVWLLKQPFKLIPLLLGSGIVIVGLGIEIVGVNFYQVASDPHDGETLLAFFAAGAAAVTWGLYTVLNRLWGLKAGGVVGLPFVMLFASALLFLLRTLFGESSQFPAEVYLPLTVLLLVPYLANVCWEVGTRLGSITLLSLLADGLPWASLTVANLYLGIAIGSKTWTSAALIVSGALLSRWALRVVAKPVPRTSLS